MPALRGVPALRVSVRFGCRCVLGAGGKWGAGATGAGATGAGAIGCRRYGCRRVLGAGAFWVPVRI
ncbi:MAG: hypothetical protein KME26_15585 [Oscillatoria princeps RMCB-10]|nr:hypothetical protein [Oscillatoria princeps RMCB-10]